MNKRLLRLRLPLVGSLLFVALAVAPARPHATVTSAATSAAETRCGWFSNPTPANASLFDRDGEWLIGVQGGQQAEGDWPSFTPRQWVETNGHYGHGCACLRVSVNRKEQRILVIESARARPLSVCRRDRALKRWGFE